MKTEIGWNGSWLPLLETGTQGDRKITRDDLDSIATNFAANAQRLPVVFGHPSKAGPVLAHIDDMRRDDNTLSGKLSNVDPRMERLVKAGLLKKRIVQIKGHGMPEGPSITGVGMIHRRPGANSVWGDVPGTDEELNKVCDTSGDVSAESQFSDQNKGRAVVQFAEGSPLVEDAVGRLRARGKWLPEFEELGLELIFAELAKNPDKIEFGEGNERHRMTALDILVSFLESLCFGAHPRSINSQRLSDLAKKRASDKNISFGEALSQVSQERPELTIPDGDVARHMRDHNGERLATLARARAEQRSISFGEALTQVASENSELTRPRLEASSRSHTRYMRDRNGEELSTLAKALADQKSISFGEALTQVAAERPELTVPRLESCEPTIGRKCVEPR
jgi:predicted transcriptional regulator